MNTKYKNDIVHIYTLHNIYKIFYYNSCVKKFKTPEYFRNFMKIVTFLKIDLGAS